MKKLVNRCREMIVNHKILSIVIATAIMAAISIPMLLRATNIIGEVPEYHADIETDAPIVEPEEKEETGELGVKEELTTEAKTEEPVVEQKEESKVEASTPEKETSKTEGQSQKKESSANTNDGPTSSEQTKTEGNPSASNSSQAQVVQRANTDTGISWDGKSPIIYTYPDGSTGTTPKNGATYEVVPGLIGTYEVVLDSAGRELGSICQSCGRTIGSGSNNTCLQSPNNTYCAHCGASVSAGKCHTCSSIPNQGLYCEYCGKKSGDGLNGTCLRYWTGGDHNCPHCGISLPTNTCHTCN
ncbi:MAG: hypothetical protein E7616_05575 [Ruminococcaceae bacterium]|nr:hypothetical protein [Oscillospiraceae bacterium]